MAIDVGSVVSELTLVVTAVAAVGLAWLTVDVALVGIRFVLSALGFGHNTAHDLAPPDGGSYDDEFWQRYNAGEAVAGVDFVDVEPLQPQYVSASEYAASYPDSAQALLDIVFDAADKGSYTASDWAAYHGGRTEERDRVAEESWTEREWLIFDQGRDDAHDEFLKSSSSSVQPIDLSVKLGGGWK